MSEVLLEHMRPQPTGGLIVTFAEGVDRASREAMITRHAAPRVRSLTREALAEDGADAIDGDEAVVLEDFNIALIGDTGVTAAEAMADFGDAAIEVRPEFYVYATYTYEDTAERTWGIAAVGADTCPFDGTGIRVAVLDTGLDLTHPDFQGRAIVHRSFVPGEDVQDGNGHGTHCCGTSVGRSAGGNVPRYGVAPGADLVVGKVLGNAGSGRETDIIRAMAWAMQEGCDVVSMSLGRAVRPGETYSAAYERIGQTLLDNGTLVVAAAGNDSMRTQGFIAPVGAPANSPSIMAVAALDPALQVAAFSSGGINGEGGAVDLAAPGVAVFSSWPRPRLYHSIAGTSMACPHVAGVAALHAQSDPKLRGRALWKRLDDTARDIGLMPRDVGAGLVQAPDASTGAIA